MALYLDRLKRSFFGAVKAAAPRLDYYTSYRARVIHHDPKSPDVVDVAPDDPRLPSMGGIPLRLGLPGARVLLNPGTHVYIAWSGGDPAEPYAFLSDTDDQAISITIVADTIELGGKGLDPIQTGALNGQAVDPYTGLQHWQLGNTSSVVRVKK
jgi:hypothetical protein